MLSAVPSSGRVNTMIRITGIGDHDRLEWLIRINGIRNGRGHRQHGVQIECAEQTLPDRHRRPRLAHFDAFPELPRQNPAPFCLGVALAYRPANRPHKHVFPALVRDRLASAYARARDLLERSEAAVQTVADDLLAKGAPGGDEVCQIVDRPGDRP